VVSSGAARGVAQAIQLEGFGESVRTGDGCSASLFGEAFFFFLLIWL